MKVRGPSISGMMVIKDGFYMGYPWLEAIACVLPWVDEFILLEGFSEKDDTWQICRQLARMNHKILIDRYRWPKQATGFAIGSATNRALSMANCEWVWNVQADELWHHERAAALHGFLRSSSSRAYDSVVSEFLHLEHNCQQVQEGAGYNQAIRVIMRKSGMYAFRDGWTFVPPKRSAGVRGANPIVHANYWFWEDILQKKDTQAVEFYPDLGHYAEGAQNFEEWAKSVAGEPPAMFTATTSEFIDFLPEVAHPLLGRTKYGITEEVLDAIWRA